MIFSSYEHNVKSQGGEDGVIEEIFRRIGKLDRTCVEFGAWDGIHFSNTWNLWNNSEWRAILIEGDRKRFLQLQQNVCNLKNVTPVNAFVKSEGKDALDAILKQLNVGRHFDLLSIDIDGDDYYILESLQYYKPRLIIIEFNHTISSDLDVIQMPGEYLGASCLALLKLAHKKGYKLCHMTDGNMFFVAEEEFFKLNCDEPELNLAFNKRYMTRFFTSYDGKQFIDGKPVFLNEINRFNLINCLKILFKIRLRRYRQPKIISEKAGIEPVIIFKI